MQSDAITRFDARQGGGLTPEEKMVCSLPTALGGAVHLKKPLEPTAGDAGKNTPGRSWASHG